MALSVSLQVLPYEDIAQLFPYEKVKENLHKFALNPYRPMIRGTGQRPDIFFQTSVAASKYYKKVRSISVLWVTDVFLKGLPKSQSMQSAEFYPLL